MAGVPVARVVEIRCPRLDGRNEVGSGTLVAPDVVLTAAHIVHDTTGRPYPMVRIRQAEQDLFVAAELIWPICTSGVWDRHAGLDVALVRIRDEEWSPPRLSQLAWARVTGRAGRIGCEAIGFPRVLRAPNATRDTDHLDGHLNPGTRKLGNRYDLHVDSTVGVGEQDDGASSPWAGMSGAGLFAADRLLGVIIIDTPGFAHNRLTAVPVSSLCTDGAFAALITGTADVLDVDSVELAPVFSPRSTRRTDRRLSPALLLRADTEVVPFHGREETFTELTTWCLNEYPDVDVRLVTGPGGLGKTRLAQELAGHLQRDHGWVTGSLRPDHRDGQLVDLTPVGETTTPLLLVVDYAETRTIQLARLLPLIWQASDIARIRLLLVARTAGSWWHDLRRDNSDFLSSVPRCGLPTLYDSLSARRQAYTRAIAFFTDALPAVDSDIDWQDCATMVNSPEDLDADRYGAPLTLQMSALLALLEAGSELSGVRAAASSQGRDSAPLERLLLDHEQRYWEKTAAEHGVDLHSLTLRTAVTAAALLGAATHEEALATLARLPGLHDQSQDRRVRVDAWLRDLYPSMAGQYWGGLQPDRIAEHLVGTLTAEDPLLIDRLLTGAADEQAANALAVLKRATAHQPHLTGQLRDVLARQASRLERVAVTIALMAKDPSLTLKLAMETLYETLSVEDRKTLSEQWLEPPKEEG